MNELKKCCTLLLFQHTEIRDKVRGLARAKGFYKLQCTVFKNETSWYMDDDGFDMYCEWSNKC